MKEASTLTYPYLQHSQLVQSDILFKAAVDTEQMLTARYNIRGKKVDDPEKTSNYIPSIGYFF